MRVVTNQAGLSKLPQVMTMHRAKGMEFSRVLIFGADDGLVPASYLLKNVGETERADALQRERSLFYVAATRARDELVVLWAGDGASSWRLGGAQVLSRRCRPLTPQRSACRSRIARSARAARMRRPYPRPRSRRPRRKAQRRETRSPARP